MFPFFFFGQRTFQQPERKTAFQTALTDAPDRMGFGAAVTELLKTFMVSVYVMDVHTLHARVYIRIIKLPH
jgi:hypothetical protein